MRLSELADKKIINLYDGEIVGSAGDSDLLIDSASGLITEIVIPPGRGAASGRRPLRIPWSAVRKIGPEVIVVDIEY